MHTYEELLNGAQVCFAPTFHFCFGGLPGHQGTHPGCSPQGEGLGVDSSYLAQSPRQFLSAWNLRELVSTAKTSPPTVSHQSQSYQWYVTGTFNNQEQQEYKEKGKLVEKKTFVYIYLSQRKPEIITLEQCSEIWYMLNKYSNKIMNI